MYGLPCDHTREQVAARFDVDTDLCMCLAHTLWPGRCAASSESFAWAGPGTKFPFGNVVKRRLPATSAFLAEGLERLPDAGAHLPCPALRPDRALQAGASLPPFPPLGLWKRNSRPRCPSRWERSQQKEHTSWTKVAAVLTTSRAIEHCLLFFNCLGLMRQVSPDSQMHHHLLPSPSSFSQGNTRKEYGHAETVELSSVVFYQDRCLLILPILVCPSCLREARDNASCTRSRLETCLGPPRPQLPLSVVRTHRSARLNVAGHDQAPAISRAHNSGDSSVAGDLVYNTSCEF
jgi:hypothetical protein